MEGGEGGLTGRREKIETVYGAIDGGMGGEIEDRYFFVFPLDFVSLIYI